MDIFTIYFRYKTYLQNFKNIRPKIFLNAYSIILNEFVVLFFFILSFFFFLLAYFNTGKLFLFFSGFNLISFLVLVSIVLHIISHFKNIFSDYIKNIFTYYVLIFFLFMFFFAVVKVIIFI